MKNRLHITDIIQYIPYGLKCHLKNHLIDYVGKETDTILGVYQLDNEWYFETAGGSRPDIDSIIPILYPLYKFSVLYEGHSKDKFLDYITGYNVLDYPKELIDILIMLNIDYNKLIEKSVAIEKI